MPQRQTSRQKIEQRIARRNREDAFLTREFKTLAAKCPRW